MGVLTLSDLAVAYGGETVVHGLNLDVSEGELVSLLGPSGAGKTTILKAVAGLLPPARGDIRIDGRSVPPGDTASGFAGTTRSCGSTICCSFTAGSARNTST